MEWPPRPHHISIPSVASPVQRTVQQFHNCQLSIDSFILKQQTWVQHVYYARSVRVKLLTSSHDRYFNFLLIVYCVDQCYLVLIAMFSSVRRVK